MPDSAVAIVTVDPEDARARACLASYIALLIERIPDAPVTTHVPVPDPEAPKFRAPKGTFMLALAGDDVLGCVSLKPIGAHTAEIKRLWVSDAARGRGVGKRLMAAAEDFARSAGYTDLKLDTHGALYEAIGLYLASGWREIPAYTEWPATHWFGKTL